MYGVGPKHELRPEPHRAVPEDGTRVRGFS
jgi:hypothetical protein